MKSVIGHEGVIHTAVPHVEVVLVTVPTSLAAEVVAAVVVEVVPSVRADVPVLGDADVFVVVVPADCELPLLKVLVVSWDLLLPLVDRPPPGKEESWLLPPRLEDP